MLRFIGQTTLQSKQVHSSGLIILLKIASELLLIVVLPSHMLPVFSLHWNVFTMYDCIIGVHVICVVLVVLHRMQLL